MPHGNGSSSRAMGVHSTAQNSAVPAAPCPCTEGSHAGFSCAAGSPARATASLLPGSTPAGSSSAPPPPADADNPGSYAFWNPRRYRPYFDVDTKAREPIALRWDRSPAWQPPRSLSSWHDPPLLAWQGDAPPGPRECARPQACRRRARARASARPRRTWCGASRPRFWGPSAGTSWRSRKPTRWGARPGLPGGHWPRSLPAARRQGRERASQPGRVARGAGCDDEAHGGCCRTCMDRSGSPPP